MTHRSQLLLIAAIVSLSAFAYAAPLPAPASAGFQRDGYGQGRGQIVTCSSDNGKRNWCDVNGLDPRNITLARQISGSPCVRDQTWGVDRRGLWVDKGCRAEFEAGGYGGGQWRPGQGQGQIVTCSSDNGKRNWCQVDPRADIRLGRQISGSPCVRGQTWGVDRRGLWVDNGCRADFEVR